MSEKRAFPNKGWDIVAWHLRFAPPGFEPGMVDLQSTALATWPRRHVSIELDSVMSTGKID
jgi:hypothetical protein